MRCRTNTQKPQVMPRLLCTSRITGVDLRLMDVRFSLKRQYHAGLAMLRECVEKASDEIWISGDHPRNFWRIAYHSVFYTHFYIGQTIEVFQPWEKHREGVTDLWADANPPVVEPYSQTQILSYIDFVDAIIDETVEDLDLDSESTGVPWYTDMSKLEHEILTIRHLQTHVGQLSEILIASGIDGEYWSSKGLKSR